MYLPPHFRSDDPGIALALMREWPLASLVSVDDEGLPFVTHLPLHAVEEGGAPVRLLGHCARANPHAGYLRARPRALVTFLGPQAYQSPSIYPDAQRVPSWNYVAVHCVVDVQLVEAPDRKDALLKTLIAEHEPAYAAQWRSLPKDFTEGMLAGIVGFDMVVTRWDCKLKLNQHRPEAHAQMRAQYAQGDAQAQALGVWMDKLGLGRSS